MFVIADARRSGRTTEAAEYVAKTPDAVLVSISHTAGAQARPDWVPSTVWATKFITYDDLLDENFRKLRGRKLKLVFDDLSDFLFGSLRLNRSSQMTIEGMVITDSTVRSEALDEDEERNNF